MPDRWGRPTYQDWTGMANQIGAIGDRNRQRQQAIETDKATQYYLDNPEAKPGAHVPITETARPTGAFAGEAAKKAGIGGPGKVSVKPEFSGTAMTRGYKKAAEARDIGRKEDKLKREFETETRVRRREAQILDWLDKNKGKEIDAVPGKLINDKAGLMALTNVSNLFAGSTEGKQLLMDKRQKYMQDLYQKRFAPDKAYVDKALSAGRVQEAVNGMRHIAGYLPMPYELGEFDPESGTFQVMFRDPETDELEPVEPQGIQEVAQKLDQVAKAKLPGPMAMFMEATRQENAQRTPVEARTKDGKTVYVLPQRNIYNPSAPMNYLVADPNSKKKPQSYSSLMELKQAGIEYVSPEQAQAARESQLDAAKTMADIDKTRTNTAIDQLKQLEGVLGVDTDSITGMIGNQGDGEQTPGSMAMLDHLIQMASPTVGENDALTPAQRAKKQYAEQYLRLLGRLYGIGQQPQASAGGGQMRFPDIEAGNPIYQPGAEDRKQKQQPQEKQPGSPPAAGDRSAGPAPLMADYETNIQGLKELGRAPGEFKRNWLDPAAKTMQDISPQSALGKIWNWMQQSQQQTWEQAGIR